MFQPGRNWPWRPTALATPQRRCLLINSRGCGSMVPPPSGAPLERSSTSRGLPSGPLLGGRVSLRRHHFLSWSSSGSQQETMSCGGTERQSFFHSNCPGLIMLGQRSRNFCFCPVIIVQGSGQSGSVLAIREVGLLVSSSRTSQTLMDWWRS